MYKLTVHTKILKEGAKLPEYRTPGSAGADLYALIDAPVEINPGETAMVPTGIAIELPSGHFGLVAARSGLAAEQGIAPANKIGVVDSDYRGEITVALHNHSKEKRVINNGDRIAQMLILPVFTGFFLETEELTGTARGKGGFGSTGV